MGDEILYNEEQIHTRVNELAVEVISDYPQIPLFLLGVLNGGVTILADFGRALWRNGKTDSTVDTIGISSYRYGQHSSRDPKIVKDLKLSVHNRDVLVVEDIVDAGYSMEKLLALLKVRGAASVEVLSLLSKKERREVDVPIKYIGFEIPDKFVFGYGIDVEEMERTRPYIAYRND